ncbi:MAG: hypothetical protein ACREBG_18595 [Pyrinomonadaceae bacterium]
MISRPPYISVEPAFDEFVTSFGGAKVSTLIDKRRDFKGSPPLNADYLFAADNVIAELKCLEEDTYSAGEFKELFNSLVTDWQDRGMLQWRLFGGPILVQSRDLPVECQLELEKLINRRLRKVVTKANKQIRLTKETLGLTDAKGLLLLVSDGNYFLRPKHVLGFVGRILRERFSSINSIVYFTVNAAVDVPTIDRDGLIWIQSFRDNLEPVASEFLSRLRAGWFQHLAIKLRLDIPEYLIDDDALVEEMRFVREIEFRLMRAEHQEGHQRHTNSVMFIGLSGQRRKPPPLGGSFQRGTPFDAWNKKSQMAR